MKPFRTAILVALLLVGNAAQAGRTCEEKPPSAEAIQKGLRLALKTREALDATGGKVALIGRVGRDLSQYGLRYSHIGIAWRDHPSGRWFVVHELNNCGAATSELFDEGLGNFFMDDLFAFEAVIATPSPAVQDRLAEMLQKDRALAFHHPSYNMVAYAFSTRYQNSNQWALEMLATALAPAGSVTTRDAAQKWYRQSGFTPTTLTLGPLTRLGGRMFRANIAFDDHPNERRFSNLIDTVTVESILAFLPKVDPGARQSTIALDR